ncbi:MAG: SDR family NAD(P)-dependent oxidoreductase [Caulobacteraceae bacterium]
MLEGVNLTGKRILVTGVSRGLGVETARTLAAHGATVVGAARDLSKAQGATAQVRAEAKNGGALELVELDLASLASVRACADGLVAGRQAVRRGDLQRRGDGDATRQESDGFETQFGTNHLGHFGW